MIASAFARVIPDAAGFFGAGTLLLIAAICYEWARLRSRTGAVDSIVGLGIRNAGHKPGRSVLSIALIASAVFLVVALDAFRQSPVAWSDPKSGAGGFPFAAESQVPLFWDPNTAAGRDNLNIANIRGRPIFTPSACARARIRAASISMSRARRASSAARRDFIELGRFSFTESSGEKKNPWLLLDRIAAGRRDSRHRRRELHHLRSA